VARLEPTRACLAFHLGLCVFLPCAPAHASPGWSSRHRRPTHRGAGQAPRVKVERPAGRTTLAVALGLLGLPWADGDEMGRLPPQPPGSLHQTASILEPEVPAGGIKGCIGQLEESQVKRGDLAHYRGARARSGRKLEGYFKKVDGFE